MSETDPSPEETPENATPIPNRNVGERSPNGESDSGVESHEFETDAMRLIAYTADALRDDWDESPAFTIDREQFNDSGTPQMLHVGRDDEGEIVWAVWNGRSEVKEHIKHQSVSLYKRLRKLLMSYEMGEEIPVLTLGGDGHVGVALVTLEERPQIKSP